MGNGSRESKRQIPVCLAHYPTSHCAALSAHFLSFVFSATPSPLASRHFKRWIIRSLCANNWSEWRSRNFVKCIATHLAQLCFPSKHFKYISTPDTVLEQGLFKFKYPIIYVIQCQVYVILFLQYIWRRFRQLEQYVASNGKIKGKVVPMAPPILSLGTRQK